MALINGSGETSGLTNNQRACLDLLEEAVEQAKDGKVDAIGIVLCMGAGYATVMAGTRAADLNLACDSLKRKILDAVETSDRVVARATSRSSILRPR